MKKIKLYFGLLDAIYGTPRNLKKLLAAFRLFLFLSFIAYFAVLVSLCTHGKSLFVPILMYLFFKYWFLWDKKCEKLGSRIREIKENEFRFHYDNKLEILLENITYFFMDYGKALEHAEKSFKFEELEDIRWKIIADKTNLRGINKYRLLNDIEEIISRRKLKEETAVSVKQLSF